MSYTYDNAGNVTTISDALAGPQTQTFTYDAVDRVTHAGATGGMYGLYSENYSYNSSTGNLYNKGGVTNTYGDTDHPHAVTARSNGNTFDYDLNGNQTQREIGNDTYDLKYDAESRLVEVKKNSTVIATFVYDGDGKQAKGTVNGVTTYYVGAYYQKQGTQVTKYYYAGAERIAMRQGGVLHYIFGDHLGSTAVVKNTQGGKTELRYTAWGTTCYEYGATPTDRRYTGQREEDSLGLYFYNARWYDPALGRFIQADTIVPGAGNPQAWDRYAYANNNPLHYTDPTGHMQVEGCGDEGKDKCHATDLEKAINAQKLAKLQQEVNDRKCAAGNTAYCSGNPVEIVAFTGIMLIGGVVAETFILGGGLANAAKAAGGLLAEAGRQAITACARNLACWRLAVGLGILSYYPANNGFSYTPVSTTLQPGQIITRYGPTTGQYASPIGTSIPARALPPGTNLLSINGFEVIQPIENVLAGPAQAWFGQTGGGTQFFLGVGRTIQSLIESGHLIQLP